MHGTFAAFTIHRTVLAIDRAARELVHVRITGPDRPVAAIHIAQTASYAFILCDNPDLRPFAPRYYAPNSPILAVHLQPGPEQSFTFRDTLRLTALIAAPETDADGVGPTFFAAELAEIQQYHLVAIPDAAVSGAVRRRAALIERMLATTPSDALELLRDTPADERSIIDSLLVQTLAPSEMGPLIDNLIADPVRLKQLAALFPGDPWAERGLPELRRLRQSHREPTQTASDRQPAPCEVAQPGVAAIGPELDRLALDGAGGEYVSFPHWCTVLARRAIRPSRELCMIACARDDGLYLLEWIAHHRSIGVEQFFIYTNDNTDGSDKLLRALAAAGEIRLIENLLRLGAFSPVYKAYGHALSMNPEVLDYRWCALIDSDELIGFDHDRFASLRDYIAWQESQPVNAIALNWLIFGSGGALRWKAEPMLSRFRDRYCEPSVKTIFRPQNFHHAIGHFPITARASEVLCRDATGAQIPAQRPHAPTPRDGPAWVAHYFCRSLEEFVWKFSRGRGDQPLQTGLSMVNVPEEFMQGFVGQHTTPAYFTRDERMLAFLPSLHAEAERLETIPGVRDALEHIHAHYRRRSGTLERALRELRSGAPPNRAAFYDLLLEPGRESSPEPASPPPRDAITITGDGRYVIDCWIDAKAEKPDRSLFSDTLDELVLAANRLIANRECQRIELREKRDSEPDGWYRITRFLVPE